MSKPIRLTEELIKQMSSEFITNMKRLKLFDGKVSYSTSLEWNEEDKAYIVFSNIAFAKMSALIMKFDSEVAWHATVKRSDDDPYKFFVEDIFVYPQVVSGTTVNTDQEEYEKWLYDLSEDDFNNLKMQCHSHVNMGVSPSPVDTTHQEKILDQLEDDMFYIFMIWNKKYEYFVKIYDMKANTLYEKNDVAIFIGDEDFDLDSFMENANDMVKKPTYSASSKKESKSETKYRKGYDWDKEDFDDDPFDGFQVGFIPR